MSFHRLKRRAGALLAALALPTMAAAQSDDPLVPESPEAEEEAPDEPVAAEIPAPDGVHAMTKTDVDAWLDGFMPYALESGGIVGAVVVVVKDGEILTSRGFGYADLETKTPVDPARTLFRPGSISKLFTWTAIMQLAEQGKIDLDADVNAYLDFEIPDTFDEPITVRHLLTHTPGFEEAVKRLIIKDADAFIGLEEYVKSSLPTRVFPPGTTPAYSNYGTALAGYIVQRVSGVSFDEYIEQNIFAPTGMIHSTFRQPLPDEFAGGMSAGYRNVADGEGKHFELVTPAPAGSLSATGEDMGRFMIAHLNDGGPLLQPETAQLMQTSVDQHAPPLNAMALGFYEQDINGVRSVGHGGDTAFFHSDLRLFLDKDAGLFISMNSAGNGGLGTLLLRENLASNFAQRYFAEARSAAEQKLETARAHGEMVAGVYESSRASIGDFLALTRYLGQMKITLDEDGDLLTPLGETVWRWREVEPFVWRKVGGHERLAVVMSDEGKVERVTFEPLSPIITYLPPPWHRSSVILNPLLMTGLAVLLLTVVLWPVRAIVRWRYGTRFALSGTQAMGYRLVRIGALAVLAYLGGWALTIMTISSNLSALTPALDPQLRTLQIAQIVLYAALALAVWNAALVWGGRRSWFGKVWSALLPISVAVVIWFAAIAGLLSFNLNY